MLPCYPVCRLILASVHREFPSTPPPPMSSVGLPSIPLVAPACPHSLGHHPTADARSFLLSCASPSCHLTLYRLASSRTPRYHSPAFFAAAVDRSAVSASNAKVECFVDPSVAHNFSRSLAMHRCEVLNCRPGLGFSPPAIAPTSTRLGNRF